MPQDRFVGRKKEQQVYEEFLARENPWLLIITGLAGIGKSTLLSRLYEYTRSSFPDMGVVKLNFDEGPLRTDQLKLLETLAEQVELYCNTQQVHSFKDALKEDRDELEQLGIHMDLKKQESSEDGQQGAQPNTSSEVEEVARQEIRQARQEIRHQVRELTKEAFYDLMDTFEPNRLAIMFDTCEWFNEPEGLEAGQWVMNELVPGLHRRMWRKHRQYSMVMASRVPLQLEVIDEQDLQYLDLPMLDKDAVGEYLKLMGMEKLELQERVFDITHGHALSVSIIGTICLELQKQGKKALSEKDFPALQEKFNEHASMKFVNERILERLDWPYNELTHYGVLLRSFNLPLLQAVFHDLRSEQGKLLSELEALEWFDKLVRYPYIESLGNYRYSFHELLREVSIEELQKEEPEKWKFYHEQALKYFIQVSPQSADRYYHAIAYDEKQGMADWVQALQEAKPNQISALLQITYDKTLKLTPASCAVRSYEQGRFDYSSAEWLTATGNMQQARTKRDAASKSFKEALELFQAVGDTCGEDLTQEAIDALGQPSAATRTTLKSYWQACQLTKVMSPSPVIPEALTLSKQPERRRGFIGRSTILLVGLALLIIAASISGYFVIMRSNQRAISNANATATTEGQINATATVQGSVRCLSSFSASECRTYLTAVEANRHAEAKALLNALQEAVYTQATSGTPDLNDPLSDNSKGYIWDENSYCKFTKGAYHVSQTQKGYIGLCFARNTNFSNFAFQVRMRILKGDCGGLLFRSHPITDFYFFEICYNGSSHLFLNGTQLVGIPPTSVAHTGLNQTNLISVFAHENNLDLYINRQPVASITDSTYSSGAIGVTASAYANPTEVVFSNAQVWTCQPDAIPGCV